MAMHARTAALHLVLVVALASTCRRSSGAALGPEQQGTFNKICKYEARNISKSLFEDGIDGGFVYLMPLETNYVVTAYDKPYKACFGPAEPTDLGLVRNGSKLPCWYMTNAHGNIDYWEHNACDVLIRSNCYCYSVGRYTGSYCEPGLSGLGKALPLPIAGCDAAVAGVIADGGKQVDAATVYSTPPSGHYIALAVKLPADAGDTGDFHFWRLDSDRSWSYKAGDTLSRNTYRNGTLVRNVERPDARGAYTAFCGFFEVQPATHKLVGNGYFYSSLPARYALWSTFGVSGTVETLPALTPAWLAAYRSYFADAGWEDSLPTWAAAKERATESGPAGDAALRPPPHTYSVRPSPQQLRAGSVNATI